MKSMADEYRRLTLDSSVQESIVKIPSISIQAGGNILMALVQGFKQLLITNAPVAIGLLLVVPILGLLWPLLKWIPYINMIVPTVVIVYVISLLAVFYGQFKNAMHRTLSQAREKTLAENASEKMTQRAGENLEKDAGEFVKKVCQLLDNKLAPVDGQTRRVLDDLSHDLRKFEDAIRDLKQLI